MAARGARLTMDGRSVAVFAAAALLVACVALVARNDNPPSASHAVLLAKDAAHARLAALALRDEQRLAAGRDDTPSAIKKLDQVAQTVSLAEDDRIIEKAKKEVLSAQKQMKHMDLFKQATKAAPPTKQLRNPEPTVLQHPVETHSGGGMVAKAAEQLWPGLQGRKTMLAPGARKHAGAKGDVVREMALAERKYKTLAKTQASTATQIRSFAKSLLSSQRQASAELRDLEKHFG